MSSDTTEPRNPAQPQPLQTLSQLYPTIVDVMNVGPDPFNGDEHTARFVESIIDAFDVKYVVETGTYMGSTTKFFAQKPQLKKVFTIEIVPRLMDYSQSRLAAELNPADHSRIEFMLGDSSQKLEDAVQAIDSLEKDGPAPLVLMYLDAHSMQSGTCALNAELSLVRKRCPGRAIVVVDDFFNPGRNYRYDVYGGKPISFEMVHGLLEPAFPEGYLFAYNDVSRRTGADTRGVGKAYIVPSQLFSTSFGAKNSRESLFWRDDSQPGGVWRARDSF